MNDDFEAAMTTATELILEKLLSGIDFDLLSDTTVICAALLEIDESLKVIADKLQGKDVQSGSAIKYDPDRSGYYYTDTHGKRVYVSFIPIVEDLPDISGTHYEDDISDLNNLKKEV